MKASEQTTQQLDRVIRKIAQKFPYSEEPTHLTDIHLRVSQDSGEMLAFDDDDNEITRFQHHHHPASSSEKVEQSDRPHGPPEAVQLCAGR